MSKKWRATVRLKKPLTRDFAFKPTKANVYENLGGDLLEESEISELDTFFEIEIREVKEDG